MKKITQEELRSFVSREVYVCQSMLVDELLKREIFDYDNIVNLTKTDKQLKEAGYSEEEMEEIKGKGEHWQEIFEWHICSDWLLEKLEKRGQPILRTDWGDWWGRTGTGQSISLDGVIEDIYQELKK